MNMQVRDLSLSIGRRRILQTISLELQPGEFIGLLGPNGAGKSSLLRCLAGLHTPQAGEILLRQRPLHTWSRSQRARHIAYLEQDADCHWPMKVEDVVALGRLPHRLASAQGWQRLDSANRQQIDRAIEESDLQALRHRPVDRLSGGERRRVMVARMFATRATILLADEPAAGLDPAHQLQLMQLLTRKAQEGATVVVVLHDLALAARFCQRVVLLSRGRQVADGHAMEVLTAEQLAATYGIEAFVGEVNNMPVILPLSGKETA